MRTYIIALFLLVGTAASAQFSKVSLQASGLTCSMCSKAVLEALQEVPFVQKVQVDIKNQRYNLTFKDAAQIEFDALTKAVEDAGFSVASFDVTAQVAGLKPEKDQPVQIGGRYFHFLKGYGKALDGEVTFRVVDKSYLSEKDAKKFEKLSTMECVKTGRAAACCQKAEVPEGSRMYHVVI